MYRTECGEETQVQLTLVEDQGSAVCAYGGAPDDKEFNKKQDYQMHASDEHWTCIGAGKFGCGAMGAMMSGKLKFTGPKMEAMGTLGEYNTIMNSLRNQLIELIQQGAIPADKIADALSALRLLPEARAWRVFLDQLLLWLGGLAVALSALFFIAYNWSDLGRFAKFGMVEALLILAVVTYCKQGGKTVAGKVSLLVTTLFLGVLLALFGQTYQTGADPWQLFFYWSVLMLPWALIGRFAAIWLIWIVLINLSILLYYQSFRGALWLMLTSETSMLWLVFSFNTLVLIIWEILADTRRWLSQAWATRLLAAGNGIPVTILVLQAIFDFRSAYIAAVLVWLIWLAVVYRFYRKTRPDLFMLAAACLSAMVAIVSFVARYIAGVVQGQAPEAARLDSPWQPEPWGAWWVGEMLPAVVLLYVVWQLLLRYGQVFPGRSAVLALSGTMLLCAVSVEAQGITIALATLAIILAVVNWSIVGKEKHLADGRKIYLELAPVDPRSLMQGDYMALRFRLADEPISIIVPSKAGGSTDTTARIFIEAAEKAWEGAEFVVKNIPGSGGQKGFEAIARAKSDGYTIGMVFTPQLVAHIASKRAEYTLDSFHVMGNTAQDPAIVVVPKDSKITSLDELKAAAANNQLTVAVNGIGSDDFLAAKAYEKIAGVTFNLLPTKGSTEQKAGILGGHVDAAFMNLSQMLSQHKAGDAHIIAILTEERDEQIPDIGTAQEQGYDVFMRATRGFVAPAGVSDEIAVKLDELLQNVMAEATFQEKAKTSSIYLLPQSSEDYTGYLTKLLEDTQAVYDKAPCAADFTGIAQKTSAHYVRFLAVFIGVLALAQWIMSFRNSTIEKLEIIMNEYLAIVLEPTALLTIFIGTVSGVLIGGMPGLTATMAVGLLVPFTYSMDPTAGLMLLGGIYCGAMYGGSIPAILLNTPGTPAAVATAIEGYPMSQQGRGGLALKISAIASFSGGTFSVLILLLFAPLLAQQALNFGPAETFLLALMGLAGIISIADENSSLTKALIAGLLGMIIALIGTDDMSGSLRYTFGSLSLIDGVDFMPALIGLFSMVQMLELAGQKHAIKPRQSDLKVKTHREPMPKGIGKYIALGSGTGTVVGILPGEGATIAAFLSYNFTRRLSKAKALFGKGAPEGIAAAEAGNNGCVGGSLVPTITLGIPGNSVAAALMGAFIIHGMIPGPDLFNVYADRTYPFILSLFVANIVFLAVGLTLAPYFARIALIPTAILIPVVCAFAVLGSYALNNSMFDVYLMIAFAALGFVLKKLNYSLEALILGLILGPIAEGGFSQGMIIGSDQLHGFEERLTTDVYPADFGWMPDWTRPDERIDLWYHNMSSVKQAGVAAITNQLTYDDEVGARSVQAIYDHARGQGERPLCLVASFIHPHDPYACRQKYWDLYDDDIPLPAVRRPQAVENDPHNLRLEKAIALDAVDISEQEIRNARRAYYGNVSYVDEWVGRLQATLAECGMAENTTVIFTSDHGDMLGEFGLWYKMSFREWSCRIPMIIHNPQQFSPRVVCHPVAQVDVLPTLTALAHEYTGAPIPKPLDPLDGCSLLPLCFGHDENDPQACVSEYLAEGAGAPMLMIRRGPYKFISCMTDPDQLFDLTADPDERVNLADDAATEVQQAFLAGFREEAAAHWDAEELRQRVIADQQRRRVLSAALRIGQYTPWDYNPPSDASEQYSRSHMDLTQHDIASRFPRAVAFDPKWR
ncbi:unnamed protein product [Cyprideis torosa]|uniref:Uncharacterized protein n=1 Tax=Cyprideis torosa TaxID=163714 RepID=A0A7R8ZFZ6_9CRUS|nr:unnamed protein product [Cyprideis torosa]CAG0878818.1 unnamed protein product [Cyprideis torosa]